MVASPSAAGGGGDKGVWTTESMDERVHFILGVRNSLSCSTRVKATSYGFGGLGGNEFGICASCAGGDTEGGETGRV